MFIQFQSFTTNPIYLEIVNSDESYPILLPKNLKTFLYHYKYSKFIECNRTIADSNIGLNVSQKNGKIIEYKQNTKKNDDIMQGLTYLAKVFERLDKPYWISDGTLLGNYFNWKFYLFKLNQTVSETLIRFHLNFYFTYYWKSIIFQQQGWFRDCSIIPHTQGK